MIIWLIFALMTFAAISAVCWPLARRQTSVRSGSDIAVYRDQLDEIGRDEAASLIGNVEAEAARVEVSRRLIAAAETATTAPAAAHGLSRRYRLATIAAAIVLLPLGAGTIYSSLGSPNLVPVSMDTASGGQRPLPGGIENTVAEVETYLAANPNNGRGWELLAPVYLRLGRFDDAVRARRNALDILGPDPARLGDLGEAIIMASNGVVTPEARSLFERANAADPNDVMAQYYLGLSARQEGRRDDAEKRWQKLLSSAPAGAEWLPLVRNALARIDEKSPSVAVAPPASGAPKGPSASDIAAAAKMAPADRNGMIEGMVARLAQKMAENGSDVDGWLRLIKAYSVLGERDKALAAAANARSALSGNSDNLRRIGDLAKELGLEG
jgi:cytochrome c-type biogenesis protein CcmH